MRQKAVWQKLKSFGSFCLILLLLPYIVTVFVHGKDFRTGRDNGKVYVTVRKKTGTASFSQIESTWNMAGTADAAGSERYQETGGSASDEPLVSEIPWEDYFVGILAREAPADAEAEFLKAQAVLVRTKLYQDLDSQEADHSETDGQENADAGAQDSSGSDTQGNTNTGAQDSSGLDTQGNTDAVAQDSSGSDAQNISDETKQDHPKGKILTEPYLTRQELEEKLGGNNTEAFYEQLLNAMQATGNQVLFYQETYAWAPFHQSSNGKTRSAQEVLGLDTYPYLSSKECPLDKEAADEMQITTFEYKDVQAKCHPFLVAVSEEDAQRTYQAGDFEIISYDSAGYVMQMRIGDTVCTGDQFRDALSLASSAFSLKDADGKLCVTTVGRGHGLGLSQWTAQQMAKSGKNYEEILQFFFEGTSLADGGDVTEKIE